MTFELVYSEGGHGGPYGHVLGALRAATRKAIGFNRTNYIEVHKRTCGLYNSGSRLFRISYNRPEDRVTIETYHAMVGFEEIDSFAVDSDSGRLYTSTRDCESDPFLEHHGATM